MTVLMALLGGVLIGLASSILYLGIGRIAGISGIVGNLLPPNDKHNLGWRCSFVLGLVLGGAVLFRFFPGQFAVLAGSSVTLRVVCAGLLVGFGTRLGNGCTSGHGVCGMGRFSSRSFIATLTFMSAGGLTVYLISRGIFNS